MIMNDRKKVEKVKKVKARCQLTWDSCNNKPVDWPLSETWHTSKNPKIYAGCMEFVQPQESGKSTESKHGKVASKSQKWG